MIIKDILIGIILATAITIFIAVVKFLKNTSSVGKSLIIAGVWVRFFLDIGVSIVLVAEDYLIRTYNFNEDLTRYIYYFISDFFPVSTFLIILGCIFILRSIVIKALNNKNSIEKISQKETVVFNADSMLSEKTEKICKKIFTISSVAIFVITLYDAFEQVLTNLTVFNIDLYYGDVSEIYYVVNDIPDNIALALCFMSILLFITSLICLFTKNELIITEKNVYGTGNFCRKISISFDKITDVTAKGFDGMIIYCGLSNIHLQSIKNRDEAIDKIKTNITVQPEKTTNFEREQTMITIHPLLKQAYRELSKIVILNIITFGIYQFVWIYKMTYTLNFIDANDQRNPLNKILLCLFIPTYTIWWFYKSSSAIKKLEDAVNVKSDIGVLCPIFALLNPIFAMLILQDNLNKIIK